MLADGTTYCRKSGEEVGANGRWHRWTTIKGLHSVVSAARDDLIMHGYLAHLLLAARHPCSGC